MDLSLLYFPNGCTVCGGKVKLHKSFFKYICENCEAYADSHRESSEYVKKYEPCESLAGKDIHALRETVREKIGKLYLERVNIGKKETALINIIYTDHIAKIKKRGDETFIKVLHKTDKAIFAKRLIDGQLVRTPPGDTETVSNRDKSLIWLAQQLALKGEKCNIGALTGAQLKKSIEIMDSTFEEIYKKGS